VSRTSLDSKFFESTRGKIVAQLRTGGKTVNDLSAALSLTDNAVRANLLSLERDRLVAQSGTIKGHRKPHFTYALTDEARHLFPKPYDSLFNGLVAELKSKFRANALIEVLRNAGRRMVGTRGKTRGATMDERLSECLAALEALGGAAKASKTENGFVIKSESCPFADVVLEHPEVCQVAEAMVEEMVGTKVRETCDRSGMPKCCFEILTSPTPNSP
jgi:predicted ArsR family transcriptional regulator